MYIITVNGNTKVKIQFSSWPQITRWSVHKYIHNVTKVMCALYVRCALSVLQKGCRKVWGARYTLGARYLSENTVYTVEVLNVVFGRGRLTWGVKENKLYLTLQSSWWWWWWCGGGGRVWIKYVRDGVTWQTFLFIGTRGQYRMKIVGGWLFMLFMCKKKRQFVLQVRQTAV